MMKLRTTLSKQKSPAFEDPFVQSACDHKVVHPSNGENSQSGATARALCNHVFYVTLVGISQFVESALAPARCSIGIFDLRGNAFEHSASGMRGDSRGELDQGRIDPVTNPIHAAALAGHTLFIPDLAEDDRWPSHSREGLAAGHKACWIEPIADCGEGLVGAIALYVDDPERLNSSSRSLISAAPAFVRSAVNMALQAESWREGDERLKSLSASLPGVVYQRIVKPDGDIRYTYMSDGADEVFGVSAKEILSDPEVVFSRHGADYKVKFRERLLAASAALEKWDVQATILRPDGEIKYTHAIARPELQEDGSVLWTGLVLDETRTREALESLPSGVVLYDAGDRLVLCNSSFLELFPGLNGVAVPGAQYKDVALNELKRTPKLDAAAYAIYSARMEGHSKAHNTFEQQVGDGRWILIDEHRARDGGTIAFYTDVTEAKRNEARIHQLAHYDALTGIPNRLRFNQELEKALTAAGPHGGPVVIMCLDVDNFKFVNDTLGHPAGDFLLKSIASMLQECLRPSDTVGRLGGDEFGIVLSDLPTPEYATEIALRMLRESKRPVIFESQQIAYSLSIGISAFPSDGGTGNALMKNADLALYCAKADGRATFRFFSPDMDADAQVRRNLETDLRKAISQNEVEVYYQPQVRLEDQKVVGFEALARWFHSELGPVSPAVFIPIAEQSGLIETLGPMVLRRACEDANDWPDEIKIAVNLSPAQFRPDFVQTVTDILRETGLRPGRLELEVTESLLLRDTATNLGILRDLKALGINIAMDDFGTGYSSLGNLRSFAFDKIKIDRSFVSELERNPESAAIVSAVLGLGRALSMTTCAEGVETLAQVEKLRSEGCPQVQGYYYSQAVSKDDTRALLRAPLNQKLTVEAP
jgi:diguanylate cyclase (GGDEF)-like protein